MSEQEQRNFWNQIWNQFDRIKSDRGQEAATSFLRKIIDRIGG